VGRGKSQEVLGKKSLLGKLESSPFKFYRVHFSSLVHIGKKSGKKSLVKNPLTVFLADDKLSSLVNLLKKGARLMFNMISAIVIHDAWACLQVTG
jgi:hypothetical protein